MSPAVSPPAADTSRSAASRLRRRALGVLVAAGGAVVLAGCQVPTFDGYRGSTKQARDEFSLYAGTVIAGIVLAVIVGGLILWSVFRYRKRPDTDTIPRQFQYHIPLEIIYTVVPVIIVLVIFGFTVVAENRIDAVASTPPLTVKVSAFQWGWRFEYCPPKESCSTSYAGHRVTVTGETTTDPDPVGLNGNQCAPAVDCLGPGLVLPAGQETTINLVSLDTIHGFYVPAFNFSRYAQPGYDGQRFDLTPLHTGIFRAQCTQLCGLYHSLMFFHVVVLPPDQFQQWLSNQAQLTKATSGSPSSGSPSSHLSAPNASVSASHREAAA